MEINQERIDKVNNAIAQLTWEEQKLIKNERHSFGNLYDFIIVYHAMLANRCAKTNEFKVHKTLHNSEGEEYFEGADFAVIMDTPKGQIIVTYPKSKWDLFQVPISQKAQLAHGGHDGLQALERLQEVLKLEQIK